MADKNRNLLIGHGERLIFSDEWLRNSREKPDPYSIQVQRNALHPSLVSLIAEATDVPVAYAPRGEVCAKIILHPQFLAKSYFPEILLRKANLRLVGSRGLVVAPRAMVRGRAVKPGATAALIVAGTAQSFRLLDDFLMGDDNESVRRRTELQRIEYIESFSSIDRVRVDAPSFNEWAEVVLHAAIGDDDIMDAFVAYASAHGWRVSRDRMRTIGGLTFVPTKLNGNGIAEPLLAIGKFSQLRVIRNMPLVGVDPAIPRNVVRHADAIGAHLPDDRVHAPELKALIMDGGCANLFTPWVVASDAIGVPEIATDLLHGGHVTSAFLFGGLSGDEEELPRPYCKVDHVRVLPSESNDTRALDVIDRIVDTIKGARDRAEPYKFANLSLGPRMPIVDDDPHEWTVRLDDLLSLGDMFMTVAAGNDGDAGVDLGRIQPPSDGVNIFSVGAADVAGPNGVRAAYSCTGPGRSPGLVKPDALACGGSQVKPMQVFCPVTNSLVYRIGTSYASPIALRLAVGLQASVESGLTPIMLHALLVSAAKYRPRRHKQHDTGWGVLPASVDDLLYSRADEIVVMYQGEITEGQAVRAPVPIPAELPAGLEAEITATFAYRAPLDPAHPVNYTRAGLEVRFQPDAIASANFFGRGIFKTEQVLRRDALKWDTCRRKKRKFPVEQLTAPSFLVSYQTRDEGHKRQRSEVVDVTGAPAEQPMPFALVIRLRVPGLTDLSSRALTQFKVLEEVALRVGIDLQGQA